jgi:hypothetical protein
MTLETLLVDGKLLPLQATVRKGTKDRDITGPSSSHGIVPDTAYIASNHSLYKQTRCRHSHRIQTRLLVVDGSWLWAIEQYP